MEEEKIFENSNANENAYENQMPKDNIDIWMEKVKDCYDNILKRRNVELWQELFVDPVCIDLDMFYESRSRFLEFIMEHSYLPDEIFRLINDTFDIEKDYGILLAKFPDWFLYNVTSDHNNLTMSINYDYFQILDPNGRQDRCDEYYDEFYDLRDDIDYWNEMEVDHKFALNTADSFPVYEYTKKEAYEFLERLDGLKRFNIYHPQEDALRAMIYEILEEYDKALECLDKIPDECKDYYIYCTEAEIKERIYGFNEEVYEIEKKIFKLSNAPHIEVRIRNFEINEVINSKEKDDIVKYLPECDRVLENVEYLLTKNFNCCYGEFLKKVNEFRKIVVNEYEKFLDLNPEFDDKLENPTFGEESNEYICIYIKALIYTNRFEKVIEICEKYSDKIENANYYIAFCYAKMEQYAQAEELILEYINTNFDNKSGEVTDKIKGDVDNKYKIYAYLLAAEISNKFEKHEKTVEYCNELIEINPNIIKAHIFRQKAAYFLKMYQTVIYDYNSSKLDETNIEYQWVIMSYLALERAKEAMNVFNEVEFNSNFVMDDEMRLLKFKAEVLSTDKDTTRLDIRRRLLNFIDKIRCGQVFVEHPEEAEYLLAVDYILLNDYEKGIKIMDSLVERYPEYVNLYVGLSNVFIKQGQYEKALNYLKRCENQDVIEISYNTAKCIEKMGREDEAYFRYLDIAEKWPSRSDAALIAAGYNLDHYLTTDHTSYRREAERLYNLYDEHNDNYISKAHLAYMYMNLGEIDKALEIYNELMKNQDEEDGVVCNNAGRCYYYKGNFNKAIECFKKSIEWADNINFYMYKYLADAYFCVKDYENALKFYEKAVEEYPDKREVWEKIGLVYENQGRYDEACIAYQKFTESMYGIGNVLRMHFFMGEKINNKRKIKQYADVYSGNRDNGIGSYWANDLVGMAEFAGNVLGKYDWARYFYNEALKEDFRSFDVACYVAKYSYILKKKFMSIDGKVALKTFKDYYKCSETEYLSNPLKGAIRLGLFGWVYLTLGDIIKAKKYFEDMNKVCRCNNCVYSECYESYLNLGYLYMNNGDKAEAVKNFSKAIEINPLCTAARIALRDIG